MFGPVSLLNDRKSMSIDIFDVKWLNSLIVMSLLARIDVSLLDPRQHLVRQHPTWFWCMSRVTSMKNNQAAPIIPYME